MCTHKPPNKKIRITCAFLAFGICKFHNIGMGKNSVTKSVMAFKTPIVTKTAFILMHLPWTVGFQAACTGMQWKMMAMVCTKL